MVREAPSCPSVVEQVVARLAESSQFRFPFVPAVVVAIDSAVVAGLQPSWLSEIVRFVVVEGFLLKGFVQFVVAVAVARRLPLCSTPSESVGTEVVGCVGCYSAVDTRLSSFPAHSS